MPAAVELSAKVASQTHPNWNTSQQQSEQHKQQQLALVGFGLIADSQPVGSQDYIKTTNNRGEQQWLSLCPYPWTRGRAQCGDWAKVPGRTCKPHKNNDTVCFVYFCVYVFVWVCVFVFLSFLFLLRLGGNVRKQLKSKANTSNNMQALVLTSWAGDAGGINREWEREMEKGRKKKREETRRST